MTPVGYIIARPNLVDRIHPERPTEWIPDWDGDIHMNRNAAEEELERANEGSYAHLDWELLTVCREVPE